MSTVFIISVCVVAVIGAAVGFFRKFTKTSFWGITVLITLLFERLIGSGVKKGSGGYGLAVILTAVIVLLLTSAVMLSVKHMLARAVNARIKLSEYQKYDERAENEELILNAVDSGDRREYKKQLRNGRKIKRSAGAWGVTDGVAGAVSGCINALTGIATVIVLILLFADLSSIEKVRNIFSASLSSASWLGTGRCLALDLPLICAFAISLRIGYNGGISSVLCIVVVLGLTVGFGAAAWSIACSDACAGAVEALKNGILSKISGSLGGATDMVARILIALIIFLLSLVVLILIAVFLPKIFDKFRESAVFGAVDGVLGAILLCAVVVMLFIVFGGIAYTLNDLPFMAQFNTYAGYAHLGDGVYTFNPMESSFKGMPIRGWFN